ncbi:MAG TPA: acyl-phosphate glycerol 3-phosphate acyltransferase, partial [Geobacteraceae bacterium]
AVMPPAVFLLGCSRAVLLVTACVAVIVIVKHHENIKRLVGGTENKFRA